MSLNFIRKKGFIMGHRIVTTVTEHVKDMLKTMLIYYSVILIVGIFFSVAFVDGYNDKQFIHSSFLGSSYFLVLLFAIIMFTMWLHQGMANSVSRKTEFISIIITGIIFALLLSAVNSLVLIFSLGYGRALQEFGLSWFGVSVFAAFKLYFIGITIGAVWQKCSKTARIFIFAGIPALVIFIGVLGSSAIIFKGFAESFYIFIFNIVFSGMGIDPKEIFEITDNGNTLSSVVWSAISIIMLMVLTFLSIRRLSIKSK